MTRSKSSRRRRGNQAEPDSGRRKQDSLVRDVHSQKMLENTKEEQLYSRNHRIKKVTNKKQVNETQDQCQLKTSLLTQHVRTHVHIYDPRRSVQRPYRQWTKKEHGCDKNCVFPTATVPLLFSFLFSHYFLQFVADVFTKEEDRKENFKKHLQDPPRAAKS